MKHLLLIALLLPFAAHAEDYLLRIKDHQFLPAEIKIPAGAKIKLLIENHDATPEEFDSHSLNREKLVAGNSSATVYIGPLTPGQYSFSGEFHDATAQGVISAE
jgi:plastocyanin